MRRLGKKGLGLLHILVVGGAVLVGSLAASDPALAQSQPRDLFGLLEGHWQGTGTVLGMASSADLQFETVLQGRFLQLSFHNTMTSDSGDARVFEAHAYYRTADGEITDGWWFDSRGLPLSLKIQRNGQSLVVDWSSEAETGRTAYRLIGADELEVVDSVHSEELMREFGRMRYRRHQVTSHPSDR